MGIDIVNEGDNGRKGHNGDNGCITNRFAPFLLQTKHGTPQHASGLEELGEIPKKAKEANDINPDVIADKKNVYIVHAGSRLLLGGFPERIVVLGFANRLKANAKLHLNAPDYFQHWPYSCFRIPCKRVVRWGIMRWPVSKTSSCVKTVPGAGLGTAILVMVEMPRT